MGEEKWRALFMQSSLRARVSLFCSEESKRLYVRSARAKKGPRGEKKKLRLDKEEQIPHHNLHFYHSAAWIFLLCAYEWEREFWQPCLLIFIKFIIILLLNTRTTSLYCRSWELSNLTHTSSLLIFPRFWRIACKIECLCLFFSPLSLCQLFSRTTTLCLIIFY